MGDRANAYVVDSKDASHGIYLYTHWSGSEWPETLRQALGAGRGRWGDESYLTRILASQVFADIHDSETGGGISTMLTDSEHPIIVVDAVNSTVSFAPEGKERDRKAWVHTQSFADYVAQPADYPQDMS